MYDERRVRELIIASLVADSYCLGSHWIYDEKQLATLDVNWEGLNSPHAIWHKGKSAGEFTHFGDQINFLYEYVSEKKSFEINDYINFWRDKISIYNGYIDGATRDTMKNLDEGKKFPNCGSASKDLSIVGRITPLLLVSSTKEEFFKYVEEFTKATHNSIEAVEASKFFAKVLIDVLEGKEITASLDDRKNEFSSMIIKYVNEGKNSIKDDTFKAIREFGPACSIDDGFRGAIHLLFKYSNFSQALLENAKAGGDNSARAMIVAILFVAKYGIKIIPSNLTTIKTNIKLN